MGYGLAYTEMVSSKGLFFNDEKTKLLLNTENEQIPVAAQIFGNDIEAMKFAAQQVSKMAPIIDINMGCPAPKVVKNGDGSKLLLNLELAENIIETVVKNSTVPVTLKIRKGWDCEHIVATEFAQMAEQAGVSAITIHGRTRTEMYSGKADLDTIKKVKDSVNIPVIGNGDVVDEESALKMFEYTGVDGIMIGRGTFGNPWIFAKIKHFLETGNELPPETFEWYLNVLREEVLNSVARLDERRGIIHIRRHLAATPLFKGIPNFRETRIAMLRTESVEELFQIFDKIKPEGE